MKDLSSRAQLFCSDVVAWFLRRRDRDRLRGQTNAPVRFDDAAVAQSA